MLWFSHKSTRARCLRLRTVNIVFLVLIILMIVLEDTEGGGKQQAKPRRRTKKSRAGVGKDFSEFLLVIGAIMACVIGPVFVFFVHSIYKDPAVPELARAGWKVVKDKFFSYLGGQQSTVPKSSPETSITHTSSSGPRRARRRNSNMNGGYTDTGDLSWDSHIGMGRGADTMPHTGGTPVRDRAYAGRQDGQALRASRDEKLPLQDNRSSDDSMEESTSHEFTRYSRYRRQRRKVNRRGHRPTPVGVAPFSSGALPGKGLARGAGIRGGRRNETQDTEFARLWDGSRPKWKEQRGDRSSRGPPARGLRSCGEDKSFDALGPRLG